jgi:hypothetical protein
VEVVMLMHLVQEYKSNQTAWALAMVAIFMAIK